MKRQQKLQLIGLSGTFSAGKDTVANAIVDRFKYNHVSTSEMVRKVASERYRSVERPVLYKTANELRSDKGAAALVIEALNEPRPLIVSGLRSLGEARAIKQYGGLLVFIDAPVEVRYERMKLRTRDSEVNLSLEEFKLGEQKEWYSGSGEADFNLRGIKALADVVIDSSVPIGEFIEDVYEKIGIN